MLPYDKSFSFGAGKSFHHRGHREHRGNTSKNELCVLCVLCGKDLDSMRIAYLECFSGMSGDMFLGALIDAGVPPRVLEETVAALGLGARLEISRVVRSGISATKVDVWADGEKDLPREEYWTKQGDVARAPTKVSREHGHDHESGHQHTHDHPHEHEPSSGHEVSQSEAPAPHEHSRAHSHSHGRGLTEIREIISRAAISVAAQKTAIAIFEALGTAEAKIHATSIEKVHFHEVRRGGCNGRHCLRGGWSGSPRCRGDYLLFVECRRRVGEVRSWDVSSARTGHGRM